MKTAAHLTGKLLYALIFTVLLPIILYFWALKTADAVIYPAVSSETGGWIMMASGGLLMLWAMWALYRFGKGLPMNAYPPPVYVSRGPYRIFGHPIYWGFSLVMTGFFIFTASASGFWIVSPLTILGIVALVMGYEEPDLNLRFPDRKSKPILSLPNENQDVPTLDKRLVSLFRVSGALVLCNFLIHAMGYSHPTGASNMVFLVLLIIIPFILRRNDLLRNWEISSLLSLAFLFFIAILFPSFISLNFSAGSFFLLSVHAFLILIALKELFSQSITLAAVFTVLAVYPVYHAVNSSNSVSGYIAISLILFVVSGYYQNIWALLRNTAETIANSWKEWIIGKVRILNRGFYLATSAFMGVLLAGFLAGTENVYALLVFSIIVTITAGLWAQLIEGSAKLKRPFGYYGGLTGIIFGTVVIWLLGYNAWIIIGVASVVMPWMQAVGRLGCLVNGCCHGRRVDDPRVGIRYFHPRSRVCNISGLKGELLHPTQLYSIIWLFFIGILLLSMWYKSMSCSFIFGVYLILTGLGRFVEESYRGEVQTPSYMGLRLYQWTAIISVAVGIVMTMVRIRTPEITPGLNWESILVSGLMGLFLFFAMGVDFPFSNARFSRLV